MDDRDDDDLEDLEQSLEQRLEALALEAAEANLAAMEDLAASQGEVEDFEASEVVVNDEDIEEIMEELEASLDFGGSGAGVGGGGDDDEAQGAGAREPESDEDDDDGSEFSFELDYSEGGGSGGDDSDFGDINPRRDRESFTSDVGGQRQSWGGASADGGGKAAARGGVDADDYDAGVDQDTGRESIFSLGEASAVPSNAFGVGAHRLLREDSGGDDHSAYGKSSAGAGGGYGPGNYSPSRARGARLSEAEDEYASTGDLGRSGLLYADSGGFDEADGAYGEEYGGVGEAEKEEERVKRWGAEVPLAAAGAADDVVVFDPLQIPLLLAELHAFICNPPEDGPGVAVRCFIERNKGVARANPLYTLYADHEDGTGRVMAYARKVTSLNGAHYVISTKEEDLRERRHNRSNQFLGKLRGSEGGDLYTLYDWGESPDETLLRPADMAVEANRIARGMRRELLSVRYTASAGADPDARKYLAQLDRHMEAIVPRVELTADGNRVTDWRPWRPDRGDTLAAMLDATRRAGAQNLLHAEHTFVLHARASRLDAAASWQREYGGRALSPSKKNFQMVKSVPADHYKHDDYFALPDSAAAERGDDSLKPVLLQLGRVGKDCFNVDYQWPLSMLQAFAISLSRFDRGTV
uniref:Tubby C-terminal domain-containing protein n=1 Tax=Phaeomonas parva TaxID=124430 RepID=A0A7S1TRJ5_9STRA